jgi:hypothetical protein
MLTARPPAGQDPHRRQGLNSNREDAPGPSRLKGSRKRKWGGRGEEEGSDSGSSTDGSSTGSDAVTDEGSGNFCSAPKKPDTAIVIF